MIQLYQSKHISRNFNFDIGASGSFKIPASSKKKVERRKLRLLLKIQNQQQQKLENHVQQRSRNQVGAEKFTEQKVGVTAIKKKIRQQS
jgi:malate/lactate dehydrogenase